MPKAIDIVTVGPASPSRGPRGLAPWAALLAVALGATLAAAGTQGVTGIGVTPDRALATLKAHTLRGMDGQPYSLARFRGEVVVLNFWATWCAPCRRELPRLEVLDAEIARSGGHVLAVSIDEDRRNVELYVHRHAMRLPVALDGSRGLARQLDLRTIPFTIVLDRTGEVAYASTRSDDVGLDALVSATRKLVAAKPVAAAEPAGEAP